MRKAGISSVARRVAVTVLAAGALLTAAIPTASASEVREDYYYTCIVQVNGVNFRTGPGTEYRSLGKVNTGQKFDVHRTQQAAGDRKWWEGGYLWGDGRFVWIRTDFCG